MVNHGLLLFRTAPCSGFLSMHPMNTVGDSALQGDPSRSLLVVQPGVSSPAAFVFFVYDALFTHVL